MRINESRGRVSNRRNFVEEKDQDIEEMDNSNKDRRK
jgi:hypothetical protein